MQTLPPHPEPVTGLCSIILPCFNRARFLPEAFEAITAQHHHLWELIIVDDGSTDDTHAILDRIAATCDRPTTIIRQSNAGAYAARMAGLQRANGEFIAFYDSDDLWLPHHLDRCISALNTHPHVDWVYAALQRVAADSGQLLEASDFYDRCGRLRGVLRLRHRRVDGLSIIDDPGAFVRAIDGGGLRCGLQKSIIRRQVFERTPMRTEARNGEDRFFALRALKRGCRFAYFNDVHLIYRVHEDHSSAAGRIAGRKIDPHRRLNISHELIEGLRTLLDEPGLTGRERAAVFRCLAFEHFWVQGQQLYPRLHDVGAARVAMRHGLRFRPWDVRQWKSMAAFELRRWWRRAA